MPGPVSCAPVARHADGGAFGEHRVEVRADEHGCLTRRAGSRRDHVADGVGAYVVQTERLEPLRHLGAARVLRAGGRGNLGKRDLCVDDPFVVGGEPCAGAARGVRRGRPSWRNRSRRGRSCAIYGWTRPSGARCRRRGLRRTARVCGMRDARCVRGDAHQRSRPAFYIPSMTDYRSAQARTQRVGARRGELSHRRVERDDLSAAAGLPDDRPRRERELHRGDRGRGRDHGRAAQAGERLVVGPRAQAQAARRSAGYAIASTMRPLVAIATSRASQVLFIRVADRVGKGIRNAPRDALIAESVDPSIRGRAFGFHRAADHAGGVRRAAHRVRGAELSHRRAPHGVLAGRDPGRAVGARGRVRGARRAARGDDAASRAAAGPQPAARRAVLARARA